jgi:hypothetical protein
MDDNRSCDGHCLGRVSCFEYTKGDRIADIGVGSTNRRDAAIQRPCVSVSALYIRQGKLIRANEKVAKFLPLHRSASERPWAMHLRSGAYIA